MSEQFIGGFTQGAAQQIATTVRRMRNTPGRGQRTAGQQTATPYQVRPVQLRVTSTTQTNGYYPCTVQQFYSGTNVFSDSGSLTVWLFTAATHAVNDSVLAFCAGVYNGAPVYEELVTPGAGRLLNRQVFTTTGANTYTPTAGTTHVFVEAIAGGGGSGGVNSTLAGTIALSCGGGGGQYAAVYAGPISGTGTMTVGAGGTAGNNTPTNAGNGGNSITFMSGVFGFTVFGGAGSLGSNGFAAPAIRLAQATGGRGAVTGADIQCDGGDGGAAIGYLTALVVGGYGGDAGGPRKGGMAMPGAVAAAGAQVGKPGKQYGGGAGGSAASGINSANGAAGAQGIVVVWEYA